MSKNAPLVLLSELFNKSVEYDFTGPTAVNSKTPPSFKKGNTPDEKVTHTYEAVFNVGNDKVVVYFAATESGNVGIAFSVNNAVKQRIMNYDNKTAIGIFSGVVHIVKDFVNKFKPAAISFFGVNDKLQKIYLSVAKSLRKDFNAEIDVGEEITIRFKKQVNELFDSHLPYTMEETPLGANAYFELGEDNVEVHIQRRLNMDHYEVAFEVNDEYVKNRFAEFNKHTVKLFSTLLAILTEFKKKHNPKGYMFYAAVRRSEPLYAAIVKMLQKKYPITVEQENRHGTNWTMVTFDDYREPVNELFKNPVSYKWDSVDKYGGDAAFTVGEHKILVNLLPRDDVFEVIFNTNGKFIRQHSWETNKHAVSIFSTVIAILEDFKKKFNPKGYTFYAADQRSVPLYNNITKFLSKRYDITVETKGKFPKWTIVYFNDYKEPVNELFNTYVPYETKKIPIGYQNLFMVGNNEVLMYIYNFDSKTHDYAVEFTVDGELDKTDIANKNVVKIFSTIVKILSDFKTKNTVRSYSFTAWDGRFTPFYIQMAKVLRKKFDIKILKDGSENFDSNERYGKIHIIFNDYKGQVSEMIRIPVTGNLNTDYTVEDRGQIVGKASVVDSVVTLLAVHEDGDVAYNGQVLSTLLQSIVQEADHINANLSMKVTDQDVDIKRSLERFGFRHVGNGIMKRRAGSIRPPSVLENSKC